MRSTHGSAAKRRGPNFSKTSWPPSAPCFAQSTRFKAGLAAPIEVLLSEGFTATQGWTTEPDDDDDFRKATITARWKKTSKLPTPEQVPSVPVHSSRVDKLDIPALKKRMSLSTRKRFEEIWHNTFYTDVPGADPEAIPTLRLWCEHADRLVADALASEVLTDAAASTKAKRILQWLEAFTVIEEAHGELRQRIIMWPRILNLYLRDKYKANVPLQHVSYYIDAVLEEEALKRDMKIGFFQIEIPADARHRFCFMDSLGRIFQLHRLPMGHSCSVELCQILMSVIAGDPAYCTAVGSAPDAKVLKLHVWIDGVRAAGPAGAVGRYENWLDENAKNMNCTWNSKDSYRGQKYTFIGVVFDHANQTVHSKEKCVEGIRSLGLEAVLRNATIAQVEALCGKLMHVSSIAADPVSGAEIDIGSHWLFLKILRRRLSALNKGLISRGDAAQIPPSALSDLDSWISECLANKPRRITKWKKDTRWLLYTDSSMTGWGSILINRCSGEVRVAGGRWSEPPSNINPAEVKAITNAIQAFGHLLTPGSIVDSLVDNTSAISGHYRGSSHQWEMNAEIVALKKRLHASQVQLDMRYVASELNLADKKSRE